MSFAAEMKDFVAAWTAVDAMGQDREKLKLQREELQALTDYRNQSLDLDKQQLELSRTNADRNYGLAAERNAIAREQAEAAKYTGVFEGLADLDTEQLDWSTGTEATDTGAEDEALSMEPEFRRGGMVVKAAEGGLLEEDPDLPFVDPQNPYVDPRANQRLRESAIPTEAPATRPAPAGAGRERSAAHTGLREDPNASVARPAAQPDPRASASVAADAQAAVADAAPALVEDAGRPEAAVGPDADTDRPDIVNNRGGLSLDEYKELVSTIDPNDQIPAYLKSAAVLASTHRYFMENGQPEKAQRIAKGILVLNKQMTQTLGALAQNAMEDGDIPAAAQFVSDAANQFPTGDQFKVQVGDDGVVSYTRMEHGEEVGSGELTAEQLWELTGKVKDGSLFIEEMGRLAESGGSRGKSETEALGMVNDAYVRAMQAKAASDAVDPNNPDRTAEEDVSPEELKRLRKEAEGARAVYNRFQSNALKMGVKRTDIIATNNAALEMAISPEAPAAEGEGEAAGEGEGWFGTDSGGAVNSAIDMSARALLPGYGAYRTAQDVVGYAQGVAERSGQMQPGAYAEELAGITPPSGVTLRPAAEADLANARAAIANGADPRAVAQRFFENGFSIEGL